MEWKRPESIPYPNTWRKFDGLREINGERPQFWIQDVTDEIVESVAEVLRTGFIMEEPLCKFSRLAEDPVSVAEGSEIYKHILQNKLSVVCLTSGSDGSPKIAGVSCLAKLSKDDPKFEFSGECLAKIRDLVDYAYSLKDPFTHLGVDEYLSDKGIYILPEFRGQGICHEFLKSWLQICKAMGLKYVVGSFTSIASQKVADRVGFKELNSFAYEDLAKVNPKYNLPGIEKHTKNLRLLYEVV